MYFFSLKYSVKNYFPELLRLVLLGSFVSVDSYYILVDFTFFFFLYLKHYYAPKNQTFTRMYPQKSVTPSSSLLSCFCSLLLPAPFLPTPCRSPVFIFRFVLFMFLLHKWADIPVDLHLLFSLSYNDMVWTERVHLHANFFNKYLLHDPR